MSATPFEHPAAAASRFRWAARLPWRRAVVLAVFALAWEAGARLAGNPLMFPTFLDTARAFVDEIAQGDLLRAAGTSLLVLAKGYVAGIALGLAVTALALTNRLVREGLQTLAAMFAPLPAIAMLPLAMLWFGLGEPALLFVLIQSVLWPFSLNLLSGFLAVPATLRMVGRNIGLKGPRYVLSLLLPAAFPAVLSGLKTSWAFAWRALVAAELVFGVSSGRGGLGWVIFQNRNELYIDRVFADLAMVVIIGLIVEGAIFRVLERQTLSRWGMQQ